MEQDAPQNPQIPVSTAPGVSRPYGSWIRLGALAVFMATLPFGWGETSSCDGPSKMYTGVEQITKSSSNIIPFLVIFFVPVLFGFLHHAAKAAWIRFGMDIAAGMLASFGTFYCFLSAALGGILSSKSSRIYPAPWFAAMAMFSMSIECFWSAALNLQALLQVHRRVRSVQPIVPDEPPTT